MKLFNILFILAVTTSAQYALAYKCETTQAGTPTNLRDYCGVISSNGLFSYGSSIYGVNDSISAELKSYADGKTKVCVDACAVEGDLQVYNIVSPQ